VLKFKALYLFVLFSCGIELSLFGMEPGKDDRKPIEASRWTPVFITPTSSVLSSCTGSSKSSCEDTPLDRGCSKSHQETPLSVLIGAMMGEPTVGGDLSGFSFDSWFPQGGQHMHRRAKEQRIERVQAHFRKIDEPNKFETSPYRVSLRYLQEELDGISASNSRNFITQAMMYVADRIAEHEAKTHHGPSSQLKDRAVEIPTLYGPYFAFKPPWFNSKICDPEWTIVDQKTFEEMSPR